MYPQKTITHVHAVDGLDSFSTVDDVVRELLDGLSPSDFGEIMTESNGIGSYECHGYKGFDVGQSYQYFNGEVTLVIVSPYDTCADAAEYAKVLKDLKNVRFAYTVENSCYGYEVQDEIEVGVSEATMEFIGGDFVVFTVVVSSDFDCY